ncbi:MAG: 2'-5' RNA ligase family protein [Lachnospiraceae bacterium]|nr:2'-5' RNA ligase family protein [Lachnospiraceae bacterium]
MYLVSVYFDEKTNKILQRYIDKIATVTGNDFMTANHVPPHLTMSSIEARNVDVLLEAFESLNNKLSSGDIQFVSVGQLLPYVMFVSPVLNEYLINLSKNIYEAFCDIPETTISRYYRPLSWLPHVTLGKKLDRAQLQKAFEVMQDNFAPFTAKVVEIGLAKVNPHEDVMRFSLK